MERQANGPVKGQAGSRGRPRRLSREMIIAAAAELIERLPTAPLSLNGVARELGVTPMAIYTYFTNSDDLMQALTAHLLEGLVTSADPAADPVETIAVWSRDVRRFFIDHPQLPERLTWEGQASIAWFDRSAVFVDALGRMGFEGRELARVTLWAWSAIMGAIHSEIRERQKPYSVTADQVAEMDASLHAPVAEMLALVAEPHHFENFFDFQIDRLIDALRAIKPAREG